MYHSMAKQVVSDASDDLRGGMRLEPREAVEVKSRKRVVSARTCMVVKSGTVLIVLPRR